MVVTIEKIAQGGAGLGRIQGKVVFVPYTLPGEIAEIEVIREHKDYSRGRLSKLVAPSPRRREPVCPLFAICGGCDFQHAEYEDQKEIKKNIFIESFSRFGGILDADPAFFGSPPFGYRNRVQVHRDGKGRYGFKEAGGSGIVHVPRCPVAVEEVNQFFSAPAPPRMGPGKNRFILFGISGSWYREEDEGEISVELSGRSLSFSPACFFQSNLSMLESLIARAFDGLAGEFALDLYGGVGTFAVFLADRFSRVLSVEEDPEASSYAEKNLGPRGCEVYRGAVEKWISTGAGGTENIDTVVVDPPRSGLSPPVRDFLKNRKPRVIVYISCDVVTLARDSGFLRTFGYRLDKTAIFDFYPQTAHMEGLCTFVLDG
jgi:23S rRNA (uracil1939-C5)-methyltransferase